MSGPSVHIAALGARTPLGLSAEASAAAVRGGITRMAMHPFLVDRVGEPLVGATDARLSPALLGRDRLTALLKAALEEVFGKLGPGLARAPLPSPLQIFVALPEPRPGFSADDAQAVLREVGGLSAWRSQAGKSALRVLDTARGHAGVLRGIEVATEHLADRRSELCVVAGVDSYYAVDTLNWLGENRQLLRPGIRGGFHPGEAAGAVVLATGADTGDQGELWHCCGDRAERMQDAGSSGSIRPHAVAEYREKRGLAKGLFAESKDRGRDSRDPRSELRLHGRRGESGDWRGDRILVLSGADQVHRTGVDERQDRGEERPASRRPDAEQLWSRRESRECGDDGRRDPGTGSAGSSECRYEHGRENSGRLSSGCGARHL